MTERSVWSSGTRLRFVVGCLVWCVTGTPPVSVAEVRSPLDPVLRAELLEQAQSLPRLRSLLVSVCDEVVEEHYFHGWSAERPANVKSVSKSIVSILVGIAIDRGFLSGVDQPIADFFPSYFAGDVDPAKRAITVGDLLTMQSGLETTSNRNYGRFVQSPDWVRHVLSRPVVANPGGRRIYSTGNTHLLSAIITQSTGLSTLDFARRYLAEPLGITLPAWLRDPQGVFFGGNEMLLPPRGMIAVGQLYLRSGTSGGTRVVSRQWVEASLTPRSRSERSGRAYGYGWWLREFGGFETYYAWGYGGQFIFVVPRLDMVAVMISSPHPGDGRRAHLRALYDMVEHRLIPALHVGLSPHERKVVLDATK